MLTHWKRLSSFFHCLPTIKSLSRPLALLIHSSHKSPTKKKCYNTHYCIHIHIQWTHTSSRCCKGVVDHFKYWEKFTTACTGPLDATAPTTISGCFIRNHADSAPEYQCMRKREVSRPVCMHALLCIQYSCHAFISHCISAHESARVHIYTASMVHPYGFGLIDHIVLPTGLMITSSQ